MRNWPENVPPVPDWEFLHNNILVQDDIPVEPRDPDEPIFEMAVSHLTLTEHQKEMLKPPEERIRELKFPKSLQDRAKRHRRGKRKNKWATKFKQHLGGFSSNKWKNRLDEDENGREELEKLARGVAKVKEKGEAKKRGAASTGLALARQARKKLDKARQAKNF